MHVYYNFIDIDECEDPDICAGSDSFINSHCNNTLGGYECQCSEDEELLSIIFFFGTLIYCAGKSKVPAIIMQLSCYYIISCELHFTSMGMGPYISTIIMYLEGLFPVM